MIPIIYHPAYNITAFGLERLHPFDSRKYRRIHDALVARGLRRTRDFVRPRPATRNDLLKVHTPQYLRSHRRPEVLAGILEVPVVRRLPAWVIDWRILRPMRFATGGTLLACRLALEHGIAINLGGGYHRAAAGWGGGMISFLEYAARRRKATLPSPERLLALLGINPSGRHEVEVMRRVKDEKKRAAQAPTRATSKLGVPRPLPQTLRIPRDADVSRFHYNRPSVVLGTDEQGPHG